MTYVFFHINFHNHTNENMYEVNQKKKKTEKNSQIVWNINQKIFGYDPDYI